MAIGRVTGPMLFSNLERQGVNLQIDTSLAYFDVTNRFLGINTTSPAYTVDARGNVRLGNVYLLGNTISTDSGILSLGSASNISITGGSANYVLTTNGSGGLSWSNIQTVVTATGITGNTLTLGSNTQGALVSNAVTLSTKQPVPPTHSGT